MLRAGNYQRSGSPAGTAPQALTFAAPAPVAALAALSGDRVALQAADGQVALYVAEASALLPKPMVRLRL